MLNKDSLKYKIIKFIIFVFLLLGLVYLVSELITRFGIYPIIKPYIDKLLNIITYNISLGKDINISFFSLISFAFIIFIGVNIARIYKKYIHSLKRRKKLSSGTINILSNLGYYSIIVIIVLSSLKMLGLDLSNFALIVSALSVGIGFGLQTIVSNFISGIILMFEQSIKEGDYIEVGTDLRGTVINISMRATTIRTNSNIDVVIPNKNFIESNIINWTHNDNIVKLLIPFGVAYGTSFDDVKKAVIGDLKKSKIEYLRDKEYEPTIFMTGMGNSSVDFKLSVWVQGENSNKPLVTKGKFLKLIYESLNKHKISIPFPQTDLHIKDSVPLQIKIKK